MDLMGVFVLREHAPISLLEYIERIVRYARCSENVLVSSMVYMDRFIQKQGVALQKRTAHLTVLVAIRAATKFLHDNAYDNAYFARLGGVKLETMNACEVSMLFTIHFELYISNHQFQTYKRNIDLFEI